MRPSIFSLLVLAAGSSAEEPQSAFSLKDMIPAGVGPGDKANREVMAYDVHPQMADEVVEHSRRALYGHLETCEGCEKDENDDVQCDGCKKCVERGTRWVVKKTIEHIVEYCSGGVKEASSSELCAVADVGQAFEHHHGGSCAKHYWCKFWHEKKAVAIGFLLQKMQPWNLVYAWCMGKGRCNGAPSDESSAFVPPNLGHVTSVYTQASVEQVLTVPGSEDIDDDAETDEVEGRSAPSDIADDQVIQARSLMTSDSTPLAGRGHICPKCFEKVFGFVMKMSIREVKKMCRHTDCPALQEWCKFGATHPAVAYGMILAKVEPWKYAIGRCWSPKEGGLVVRSSEPNNHVSLRGSGDAPRSMTLTYTLVQSEGMPVKRSSKPSVIESILDMLGFSGEFFGNS